VTRRHPRFSGELPVSGCGRLLLSLRHGRANQRGRAGRVRHRAADRVRGKARLLAVRLDNDCYAFSGSKGDRQQDHVLVVDPPARRVAGRADDRDRALGALDGERLQTLSGRGVGEGRRRGQRDRRGRERANCEKSLHVFPLR
jgi:hypothetical protein